MHSPESVRAILDFEAWLGDDSEKPPIMAATKPKPVDTGEDA